MIFNKEAKAIQWSKDNLFNKCCWNHMQKMNLDTDFTPFTKINLKWITDLNVKHKTIKLLKDNIGETLDDLGYGDDFFFKIQHQRHDL